MGTAREPIFDWKPYKSEVKSFDLLNVRRTVARVEGEVTYLDNKDTDTNTVRSTFTEKYGFYYTEDLCLPLHRLTVSKTSDTSAHVVAEYRHSGYEVPFIDIDDGIRKRPFQRTIEWIPSFGVFGTDSLPDKAPSNSPVLVNLWENDTGTPFQLRPVRWTQTLYELRAAFLLTTDPELDPVVAAAQGTTNSDPIILGGKLRPANTVFFKGPSVQPVEVYEEDDATGSALRYAGDYMFIYNEHGWKRTAPILLGFPGPDSVSYGQVDEYARESWALKPQVAPQDPNIPTFPIYTPNCA